MERTCADHMGMLATTINALALQDALEQRGVDVRVQTAIEMNKIAERTSSSRATRHLERAVSLSSAAAPAARSSRPTPQGGSACGRDRRGCYPCWQRT